MAKKRIRDKRKTLVCFVCEKKILPKHKVFYVPLEYPYGNFPIHRNCKDAKELYKKLEKCLYEGM